MLCAPSAGRTATSSTGCGVPRSPNLLLHMVRKASHEVLGVSLCELGEAARLAAANTGDRVGRRLPFAPAADRGYEGVLVGALLRQATLSDEDFAKGLRVGILVDDLLPDGLAYAPGGIVVGECLRSAHHVCVSEAVLPALSVQVPSALWFRASLMRV